MFISANMLGLRRLHTLGWAFAVLLAGCGPASAPASTPAQPPAVAATAAPPSATPTTAPTTDMQPSAVAAQPGKPAADVVAAVQVALDYYAAINQQQLEVAYQLWANNGAASGQTLEQFKSGFASTVAVSLRLGTPSPSAGAQPVTVPVELVAITNAADPQQEQKVSRFRGSYLAQPGAQGWRLVSANIAETSDAALPDELSDPTMLLQHYYDLIDRREFAPAYTLWGQNGQNSNQTFAQFTQGYAATNHVAIELGKPAVGGAAGSVYADVPAVILATQAGGGQQTFCGAYTLRRLNVPPFDQLGWRIESATIAPTAAVALGGDQSRQLLAGGCEQP